MALIHPKIKPIGRPAFVLLPVPKVENIAFGQNGKTPHELLSEFCLEHFNAYSIIQTTVEGYWKDKKGTKIPDFHRQFRVSFSKKAEGTTEDNLNKLIDFLSILCGLMKEDCLYVEFGEDSFLIFP